ncbi:MAG: hypothetical protein H0W84_00030 [Bacteroidetes bacterium]|nr:hypothetical protein [Bacteroidota bacterium]
MKYYLILLIINPAFFLMNWLNYSDNNLKFSIKYPATWIKQPNPNIMVFLSPKENVMDMFQENVNVILQNLSRQPMTIEQYTEVTKRQVVDNFGASAIVSLKNVTIAGETGRELIYNMNYQGKKLKVKQCWIIKNHNAYLLTYTAEPEQYNKYENIAVEMTNSFKLL